VETPPAWVVGRLELFGTESPEMTVAPRAIVERINVVSDVRDREVSALVDLLL
jgi:hypothetical protein